MASRWTLFLALLAGVFLGGCTVDFGRGYERFHNTLAGNSDETARPEGASNEHAAMMQEVERDQPEE
ncbi:MAG: hypothetical protein HY720_04370 [Planctomycetes bacterium]|nr:hypothetical protein [Planctomycetota bacterium]